MPETEKPRPVIDKKYLLSNEKFKNHVLYAGLLDAAHGMGLCGINTDLVQAGTPENGQTWVVRAVVMMADDRQYTGLGDASPANVNRMMANCLPRMAETRAKARALRDAINASEYELDESDLPDRADDPKATSLPTPSPNGSSRHPQDSPSPSGTSSAPTPPTATGTATTSPARAAGSGSWPSSTPTQPSSGASPRRVATPAPGARATTAAPAGGTAAPAEGRVSGDLETVRKQWEEVDAEAELLGLPKIDVKALYGNPTLLAGVVASRREAVARKRKEQAG